MNHKTSTSQDYYPFGPDSYRELMPTGTWDAESSYRFGFNTQERVDEISGKGNHNTALFWEYDTRLGRRWNLDPKPQMFISDYAAFENNPILITDILGDKVDYKKFGDRVRVGLKRATNKDFRADFNSKKANQDMTFVYGKDKLANAKLADAKPQFSAPEYHYKNDTPISNIKYNTPGLSVEVTTQEKVLNATKQQTIKFSKDDDTNLKLPKDGACVSTSATVPNVVPNTEITFDAKKYTDIVTVSGTDWQQTRIDRKGSTNSGSGGTVTFTMESDNTFSTDPNRPMVQSQGTFTYFKYRSMNLPVIKLNRR